MNNKIVIIVTGADLIPNITHELRRERFIEYTIALYKIFRYKYPIYGVLSEYDRSNTIDSPPFNKFRFNHIKYIDKGQTPSYNKSHSEMLSIISVLDGIDELNIDDNTFVVKFSGRYSLIDDTFINTVEKNVDTHVPAIVKSDGKGVATYLFALRYKYFKEFYRTYNNPEVSVEYLLYDYLVNKGLIDKSINVDLLGILTNVCNGGKFILS